MTPQQQYQHGITTSQPQQQMNPQQSNLPILVSVYSFFPHPLL